MLAGIRDVTPRRRLGHGHGHLRRVDRGRAWRSGRRWPGILIDGLGWSLPAVFWLSAALSVGTALLVTFGSREVRPVVVPQGRIARRSRSARCAASWPTRPSAASS